MAVRHLAKLLPLSRGHIVFNVVDPGLCKTELARNAPQAFRDQLSELHEKYGRTSEMGSRTLLSGAVAGGESHGRYMDSCEVAE
jgi:NAD(P)-dependent dehydrogenase (short-subunit alcohol dehydrogenase family)